MVTVLAINVFTPNKISSEEKKLLKELLNSENFKPDPDSEKGFFDKMKDFFHG